MKNDVATLRLVAELNENPWPNRLQNFGRFHENMHYAPFTLFLLG